MARLRSDERRVSCLLLLPYLAVTRWVLPSGCGCAQQHRVLRAAPLLTHRLLLGQATRWLFDNSLPFDVGFLYFRLVLVSRATCRSLTLGRGCCVF
jgi:hypothetical protein